MVAETRTVFSLFWGKDSIVNGLRRLCRRFQLVLVLCFGLVGVAQPAVAAEQNNYPLILVHGFAGWGPGEMLGYRYWGGFGDIEGDLNAQGYRVMTAVVGPVSSNWDRACELFAYIRGGRVDYGAAHSDTHGHARFGRSFPGLYPEWGERDSAGAVQKVHLLAHSMGGQTVRVLVQLLETGSSSELTAGGETSMLFQGGHDWVRSVTTLSTPHDGTSLADGVNGMVPFAQQLVAGAAALSGLTGENILYDWKLDQWGLVRRPGEAYAAYNQRVFASNLWKDSRDLSAWDLSPRGACELNQWVRAQPQVYYFSLSTEATYGSWLTGYHYPEWSMNPLLSAFAVYMGHATSNQPGGVVVDSSWWPNDGVVNTRSMAGPTCNSQDRIVSYDGAPQAGIWNDLGVWNSWDHMDIVGHTFSYQVYDLYRGLVAMLEALPQ